MAQWFVDSASITNLIVTRSYIGSGSTSFNKSQSALYINNGLRQGIDNTNFNTSFGYSNHIAGFFNGNSTTLGSHIEGYSNSRDTFANGDYFHVEGKENDLRASTAHIEGENNFVQAASVNLSPNFQGYHAEGGNNTSIGVGIAAHVEGYSNYIHLSNGSSYHAEGINNTYDGSPTIVHFHIEGANHSMNNSGYRYCHIEGENHNYCQGNGSHIQGYNNYLKPGTQTSTNHIEGGNNTIDQIYGVTRCHINGISCSISSCPPTATAFMSGLGLLKTNFAQEANENGSTIFGHYNTFNEASYQVFFGNWVGETYMTFIVGGGLNNSTRKNIFETSLIASASSIINQPTRSVLLPWVSESGDFIDDTAAATGGVPLGGFYRTGNSLKIRLS